LKKKYKLQGFNADFAKTIFGLYIISKKFRCGADIKGCEAPGFRSRCGREEKKEVPATSAKWDASRDKHGQFICREAQVQRRYLLLGCMKMSAPWRTNFVLQKCSVQSTS
jgi:hypothetical protein